MPSRRSSMAKVAQSKHDCANVAICFHRINGMRELARELFVQRIQRFWAVQGDQSDAVFDAGAQGLIAHLEAAAISMMILPRRSGCSRRSKGAGTSTSGKVIPPFLEGRFSDLLSDTAVALVFVAQS